ncbi:hypothetical protein [Enterococcus faecium]|nr:hypothetical protein [Enterococcus faecium]
MNKKIENLIEELKRECQKQGVSIICTAQKVMCTPKVRLEI